MQLFLNHSDLRRMIEMEISSFNIQQEKSLDLPSSFTISVLENSIEFYLEYAFIIRNTNYHLFIRNSDTVLMDQFYKTETEAKEAFLEYFGDKGWRSDITASWSQFFVPDIHWIEFLLSDYKNQTVNF